MRDKLQEVVINIWCGALDAAAMKREFQSVEDYENAYAKYKAKVEQAAIDDILDLLDKSLKEARIDEVERIPHWGTPYDTDVFGYEKLFRDIRIEQIKKSDVRKVIKGE